MLPPAATQVVLAPTHPLTRCVQPTTESLTNGAPIEGITLLRRAQAEADTIPFSATRLPIGSFDPAATRRPAQGRLGSTVHVVPSSHVATDGDCGVHERPGACIVLDRRRFACFSSEEVSVGRALVRGRHGSVVGIAPDGIDRVTISGTDAPAGADVVENVYEAHFADAPGSLLTLSFHRSAPDGCERDVSRALLARVSALRADPVPAIKLPRVVLDVLGDSQLDAIVDAGARYWGESAGVDFWVVPVVPLGEPECAPASSACVVAVVEAGRRADAECALADESGRDAWRLAPLLSGRAAIYGVVPDGIIGARVTIGGRTAEAAARDNVVAGVLPFGYGDPARTEVELIRHPPAPVIGVVDASGIRGVAENLRARIRKAGYATVGAIRTSPQPQPHTEVYWWPEGTRPSEAERVSDLLRADLHRIEPDRMPRPVRETRAPIVVVVGSEP